MSIETVATVLNMDFGDPTRKLIAIGLANHAWSDGTVAYPSVKKLAAYAGCSERTVQRHIQTMLEEGMIRRGDQLHVIENPKVDPRRRPIVYDIALNGETRDRWKQIQGCRNDTPDDQQGQWGDTGDGSGVTDSGFRGDTAMSPKPSYNHPSNYPSSSLRSDSSSLRSAESPGSHESGQEDTDTQPALIAAPTPPDGPGTRQDVESLCNHLAYRIEHNGSKPPTITAGWRKAARLLLDSDRRDLTEAHWLIDWCQDDTFWQSNILSMTKFRQKYDQLRLKARQQVSPEPRRPVVYIDFGAEAANG